MRLFIGNKSYNINHDVKFDLIKLVNYKLIYLGIFSFYDAFLIANNLDLDLVEISSSLNDSLSVCRLVRYGRFQYIENAKFLKKVEVVKIKRSFIKEKKNEKEMSFSLFIDIRDYFNKINKIIKFLNLCLNVKIFIIARGRMAKKINLISELLNRIKFDLRDYSFVLNGSFSDINNQFYLYFYNSRDV